jgi:TRAP-type C4-dicarboxylate transport system permease small subunit
MGGFNQVLPTFPLLTQGGMYIAIPLNLTATVLVCLVKIMRIISGESVRKSAVVDVPSA